MSKNYFTLALIILGLSTHLLGQQHTENKPDQVLRGSGRVNASTLGMEIEIPLGNYPGRGIDMPVNLSYSSKVWRLEYSTTDPVVNSDRCVEKNAPVFAENSAAGWTTSLAVPYIEYTGYKNPFDPDGQPVGADGYLCRTNPGPAPAEIRIKRINIHLPGGETHELRDETVNATGVFPSSFDGVYYAADGSNLKYVQDSAAGTYRLLMPDGSFYEFAGSVGPLGLAIVRKATRYNDRNGNYTSFDETTGAWTDTLGRRLAAPFGLAAPSAPTVTDYTLPGMSGGYKFHWKMLKGAAPDDSALTDFNQALRYYGDKYLVGGQPPRYQNRPAGTYLFGSIEDRWVLFAGQFNPVVLAEIELPTGRSYRFTYDVYGRIERIYYPTGGEERFTYAVVPPVSGSGAPELYDQTNFGVARRQVFPTAGLGTPYEWNYSAVYVSTDAYKVTVVNPDETSSERYLHRNAQAATGAFGYGSELAGMAFDERIYSSAGRIVSQKLTSWIVSAFGAAPSGYQREWHPRVVREESRSFDESDNGVAAVTAYFYDGDLGLRETPLLLKKTSSYHFTAVGAELPAAPARSEEKTLLVYDENYPPEVRDFYRQRNMIGLATAAVVTDGAGAVVSRSEMRYDEPGRSPAGRGNPTTSRVWDSTKGSWNNPAAYLSTTARFDSWGNRIEATDAQGRTSYTAFDPVHHAFPVQSTSTIPDPTGQRGSNTPFVTRAVFDPVTGLPLATTDANGVETRIEYDPVTLRPVRTRRFHENNPLDGATESVYYDEPGDYRIKSRLEIGPDLWAESITYFDGLGRSVKTEDFDSSGNVFVEKEFNENGRVKRVTNPFRTGEPKHWTTNVYDEAGRVKEVILPDGARVRTDFGVLVSDLVGVTKQITDQAGKKRKGVSDAFGRMIRVIEDPDGQGLATDYAFDALGNLRRTVQGEQSRFFAYDSLGRLRYAKQTEQEANPVFVYTDPQTGNSAWSVKYEYDDNGNMTRTTDARGVAVEGTYDGLNRLTFRNYSDATPDVDFYYDGRGLGAVPAFSAGKLTRFASAVSETRYTAFDRLGRLLTSEQRTPFGDEAPAATTPRVSAYEYDAYGKLVAQTYPSGRTVKIEYDRDGEVAGIRGTLGSQNRLYANNFAAHASGALERLRLGNGRWETIRYNERLQITRLGLGTNAADTSLLRLDFGYGTSAENNGSLRSQSISVPPAGGQDGFTAAQTYEYDDLNRLRAATERLGGQGAPTWQQTFAYDRYGNRRLETAATTPLPPSAAKIGNPLVNTADNRLKRDQDGDAVADYLYDRAGNLVLDAENRRFVYDAENRQTQFFLGANNTSTPDAKYVYDGDGRRVKKISSTETVVFVYDGGGQLVAEYSTVVTPQPQVSYLTQDHLGSPRIITNAAGAVTARKDFAAFGEETFTPQRTEALGYKPENIRQDYTGYLKDDESGLQFAQARYYNTAHGRFTSVDPLTASADSKDPQTFNRYSYAINSPYKFTDPLGLISQNTGACGNRCANSDPRNSGGGLASTYGAGTWTDVPNQQESAAPTPPPSAVLTVDGTTYVGTLVYSSVDSSDTTNQIQLNLQYEWATVTTEGGGKTIVPVTDEVSNILNDALSRVATNSVNAHIALANFTTIGKMKLSMEGSLDLGTKYKKTMITGGNVGGSIEIEINNSAQISDQTKAANDKIQVSLVTALQGKQMVTSWSQGKIVTLGDQNVADDLAYDKAVTLPAKFAQLMRVTANQAARDKYNETFEGRRPKVTEDF